MNHIWTTVIQPLVNHWWTSDDLDIQKAREQKKKILEVYEDTIGPDVHKKAKNQQEEEFDDEVENIRDEL